MQSIPELIATKKGVEITHEAAVGKISEKEITYLMTRKITVNKPLAYHTWLHGREHSGVA